MLNGIYLEAKECWNNFWRSKGKAWDYDGMGANNERWSLKKEGDVPGSGIERSNWMKSKLGVVTTVIICFVFKILQDSCTT